MNEDLITDRIIGCCFKVHSALGPGFNEKVYQKALELTLEKEGLNFENEKEFHVFFEKRKVGTFRVDMLVENSVIVEIKAVTGIMPMVFKYQLLSYLKASQVKVGLLVNFGNKSCEVKRIVY